MKLRGGGGGAVDQAFTRGRSHATFMATPGGQLFPPSHLSLLFLLLLFIITLSGSFWLFILCECQIKSHLKASFLSPRASCVPCPLSISSSTRRSPPPTPFPRMDPFSHPPSSNVRVCVLCVSSVCACKHGLHLCVHGAGTVTSVKGRGVATGPGPGAQATGRGRGRGRGRAP